MAEQHVRTRRRRKRVRARFWDRHADEIRLGLIGGGVILVVSWIAKVTLGS